MFSVHDVQQSPYLICDCSIQIEMTPTSLYAVLTEMIHQGLNTGQNSKFTPMPIDHYCSPDANIGWCDWCWLSWKQIHEPLSQNLIDYGSLDAEKDAFRLQRETSITKLALRNMHFVMLLKAGVSAGLGLSEIASLMVRNDTDLEVAELR